MACDRHRSSFRRSRVVAQVVILAWPAEGMSCCSRGPTPPIDHHDSPHPDDTSSRPSGRDRGSGPRLYSPPRSVRRRHLDLHDARAHERQGRDDFSGVQSGRVSGDKNRRSGRSRSGGRGAADDARPVCRVVRRASSLCRKCSGLSSRHLDRDPHDAGPVLLWSRSQWNCCYSGEEFHTAGSGLRLDSHVNQPHFARVPSGHRHAR